MNCINCQCNTCLHKNWDCDGCADCDDKYCPKTDCKQYISNQSEETDSE